MKIYIRTDASITIGTGHVMRCLTLAEGLKEHNAEVSFICRNLEGNLSSFIEEKGFMVYRLENIKKQIENVDNQNVELITTSWEEDAHQTIQILEAEKEVDWLIVDHYSLDIRWELKVREYTKKIMVIDDLANREHDCDLLLDQNYYKQYTTRYDKLVPNHCIKILGPQYALLRKEFKMAKEHLVRKNGDVKNILVFFGGSDPTNETEKTLMAIRLLNKPNLNINVVVGKSNPFRNRIEQLCSTIPNTSYFCQINNMAELIASADLAIGAGGSTTLERLYLGLPSIVIIVAENQYKATVDLEEAGAIINLGYNKDVTIVKIKQAVEKLIEFPNSLYKIREEGLKLIRQNDREYALLQYILEK